MHQSSIHVLEWRGFPFLCAAHWHHTTLHTDLIHNVWMCVRVCVTYIVWGQCYSVSVTVIAHQLMPLSFTNWLSLSDQLIGKHLLLQWLLNGFYNWRFSFNIIRVLFLLSSPPPHSAMWHRPTLYILPLKMNYKNIYTCRSIQRKKENCFGALKCNF